jgi:BASS family bile acid:Na+ symporter
MNPTVQTIRQVLQRHLLWFLILAYALGAFLPEAGLWIRGASGTGHSSGQLLKAMLALLLLNVGLRVDLAQLGRLARHGGVLVTSLACSVLAPGLFVLGVACLADRWAPSDMLAPIVMGLAVVAAMPVAASSTAWAQNAEGDLALSLGLLLLSTALSPLTAVLILQATASVTGTVILPELTPLVTQLAAAFLTLWVILPIAGGLTIRGIIGAARIDRIKSHARLLNLAILLVLNYTNASLALPSVIAHPQPASLLLVIALCFGLAAVSFAVAPVLARLHRADSSQSASLLFAMGMKNNGAGLVLVATVLPISQSVLLPIIVYNLTQHLVAAALDRYVVPRL